MGQMAKLARGRAARGRAGGRLPEPRPLALPVDGDLGDGPARDRGARDRLARPGARRAARRARATTSPALHVGTRALPLALQVEADRGPVAGEPGAVPAPARRRRRPTGAPRATRSTAWPGSTGRRTTRCSGSSAGAPWRPTTRASGSSRSTSPSRAGRSIPNFGLARRLELIAQIIKAGFGTRIYYTSLDGFDTHANQLGTHAALLTELSDSIAAFHADLAAAGQADRVALLTFSEFGRRVAENASPGTDHGAAAPVFVVGPVAQAGLVGAHPSLDDLDDGDLKHHTDFRRVYATLLETWLGCPPRRSSARASRRSTSSGRA